jgi:hypothetical protein
MYLDFNINFIFFNWVFKKTKETGLVSNIKSSVCLFFTSKNLFSNGHISSPAYFFRPYKDLNKQGTLSFCKEE